MDDTLLYRCCISCEYLRSSRIRQSQRSTMTIRYVDADQKWCDGSSRQERLENLCLDTSDLRPINHNTRATTACRDHSVESPSVAVSWNRGCNLNDKCYHTTVHYCIEADNQYTSFVSLLVQKTESAKKDIFLACQNSPLSIGMSVREARSNDTRAGTLPCEPQRAHVKCLRRRTSRLRILCMNRSCHVSFDMTSNYDCIAICIVM